MLRTLAAIALLTVALALPGSALAMNGPTGGDVGLDADEHGAGQPPARRQVPADADGRARRRVEVVRVVKPGGFDFRDAGIGAAVGALVIALVGGVVILASHNGSATRVAGTRVG